jgi:hypothetical protein
MLHTVLLISERDIYPSDFTISYLLAVRIRPAISLTQRVHPMFESQRSSGGNKPNR